MLATSPITVTTGASRPSRSAAAAMVASVAIVTRWSGVVADWMHAAGVSGSRPAAIRSAVNPGSPRPAHQHHDGVHADERTQVGRGRVRRPGARSPPRTTAPRRAPSPGCPRPPVPRSRWRRPAPPRTARPPPRHASSSSLPRPNTNGSPPLSRTTVRPALACSTSSSLISSCVSAAWPRPLPTSMQLSAWPSLVQQRGADQPVVHHDVGPSQQLEAARGDEARITGAGAHQVHRSRARPGRVRAAPAQARARRRMAAGQVHDDVHDAGKRADRLVHHDPRASLRRPAAARRARADGSRHVLRHVAAAADQERDDDHGVRADLRAARRPARGSSSRNAATTSLATPRATQRLRELEGGLAARRMAQGPVPREQHRRLRPARSA